MKIKKSGNIVYGAEFTAAERRAMSMEIERQLAEYDRKHSVEIEALNCWVLHEAFGFGPKRLKQFHEQFKPLMEDLINHYGLEDSDAAWICTKKLKEKGIDLEEWNR